MNRTSTRCHRLLHTNTVHPRTNSHVHPRDHETYTHPHQRAAPPPPITDPICPLRDAHHESEAMERPSPDIAMEASGDSEEDSGLAATAEHHGETTVTGECDGDDGDAESRCGGYHDDDDDVDDGEEEEKEERWVCWRTWLVERASACQPAPGEDVEGWQDGCDGREEMVNDDEILEENRRFWDACLANEYPY